MSWRDKPRVQYRPWRKHRKYVATWNGFIAHTNKPLEWIAKFQHKAQDVAKYYQEPAPSWAVNKIRIG